MLVVTGCPRSGTSLMMRLLRAALGEDRCIGHEHPAQHVMNVSMEKFEKEEEAHYQARRFSMKSDPRREKQIKKIAESMDMNPHGFWEDSRYVMTGYRWHVNMDYDPSKFVKIVCSGLYHTDPRYVKKVIYMARHPRAVAKSQERLKRNGVASGLQIHSPERFINDTLKASSWFEYNKEVSVIVVSFDQLIENPEEVIPAIEEFIGEGDWAEASKLVNPKLRRSNPTKVEDDQFADAEEMYKHLLMADFTSVLERGEVWSSAIQQNKSFWVCQRNDATVNHKQCVQCFESATVRDNYRQLAIDRGIDFEKKPCLYDAGMDRSKVYEEGVDYIQLTIENNHWVEDVAEALHLDCKHRDPKYTETRPCTTCKGGVDIHIFPCTVYGLCNPSKKDVDAAIKRCAKCDEYEKKTILAPP